MTTSNKTGFAQIQVSKVDEQTIATHPEFGGEMYYGYVYRETIANMKRWFGGAEYFLGTDSEGKTRAFKTYSHKGLSILKELKSFSSLDNSKLNLVGFLRKEGGKLEIVEIGIQFSKTPAEMKRAKELTQKLNAEAEGGKPLFFVA